MRIALAQTDPTVGDFANNRARIEQAAEKAAAGGADLMVAPEMALMGYPPRDLLDRRDFVQAQLRELDALLPASRRIPIVVGAVLPTQRGGHRQLENAAVLLADGRRVASRAKSLLPTYDVFDESRWFAPAAARTPVSLGGDAPLLGLTVCEDCWAETLGYAVNPVAELALAGVRLVLNPSASPWHLGKPAERRRMLSELAARHRTAIVFVNQVGGNDELVFDGGSCAVDPLGRIQTALPLFEPALEMFEVASPGGGLGPDEVDEPSGIAQLEAGLTLGIRDYFLKQGLPPGAVIGLSGGIDSAVTAHLAVRALGAGSVVGVAMPGPFSSDHSQQDARAVARNLGIALHEVDVRPLYDAYLEVFAQLFGRRDDYGLTQQNIQARIRGAILMAVSNHDNRLVLATGNKSELSIGYCTLYGDMVGGLAVLGDVYKQDVYALARHANREAERIPVRTIEKPPSAELAADQYDSDDLPVYEVLDAVLGQLIEGSRVADEVELPPGATRDDVLNIARRLDRNEYKRRQAPLVLRTSPKAFGAGRRLPIVHRYG